VILAPADVVFVQGDSWVSRAIRWRTRSRGEAPTMVNHVGVIVSPGDEDSALVVEALFGGSTMRTLRAGYGGKPDRVSVHRPLNLTVQDQAIVASQACSYVGRRYGWGKILGQIVGVPGLVDRWPICSWVVARAFAEAGYYFGRSPRMASPDDIHDFVLSRPDRYSRVRPLIPISPLQDV
jgi:hypothetical protein